MINDKKSDLILKNKNIYKAIILLAIPVCLSNLLKSIHDLIDMYFVTGDNAIAAISFPSSVIALSQSLAIGLTIAGAAIMSQSLGAKNKERANKTSGQLLMMCLICGIVFNILLFVLIPYILQLMGASPKEEMYRLALAYVRIRSFEMIPLFLFYSFQATRQASGDTVTPVVFNIFSVILNIILTWIFVKKLNMGVNGAAIATLIANIIIMPPSILMMFCDKKADITIKIKDLKIDFNEIKIILKLGVPSALAQAFASIGFLFINGFIKKGYGNTVVTAFSVGNRINSLVLMPIMGIGGIIATFVGQNIGADNEERARKCVKTAMILAVSLMAIGGMILLPFSEFFSNLFLENDSESFSLCTQYMFFLFTGLPLMGIFQVFMGTFQGTGYTKFAMILSSVRLWGLRIPFVYICIYLLKLDCSCLWYAMILSNFLSVILGIILYRFCKYKKIDKKIKGELKYGNS